MAEEQRKKGTATLTIHLDTTKPDRESEFQMVLELDGDITVLGTEEMKKYFENLDGFSDDLIASRPIQALVEVLSLEFAEDKKHKQDLPN